MFYLQQILYDNTDLLWSKRAITRLYNTPLHEGADCLGCITT